MSNTTQENIAESKKATNTAEEPMIDVYDESEVEAEAEAVKEDLLAEIGDTLDVSGIITNPNTIRPEVFRKLSYWQKWSLRRQAGLIYYAATYSVYTFVAYVGLKMFYLVYLKDFRFKLDWWSFPLAIIVGLAFWFIHEAIFKKKLSDATKK